MRNSYSAFLGIAAEGADVIVEADERAGEGGLGEALEGLMDSSSSSSSSVIGREVGVMYQFLSCKNMRRRSGYVRIRVQSVHKRSTTM